MPIDFKFTGSRSSRQLPRATVEVPVKPTGLQLDSSTSDSLSISWDADPLVYQDPNVVGTGAGYIITATDSEDNVIQASSGLDSQGYGIPNVTITGLQPATTYDVVVRGYNPDGLGPQSDPLVASTAAGAPDAPTNVQIGVENELFSPFAPIITGIDVETYPTFPDAPSISSIGVETEQAAPTTDPYFSQVVALLDDEASQDLSYYGNTVVATGAVQQTSEVKFGTNALFFDGVNDHLTISGSGESIGTGDFTIEWWQWVNNPQGLVGPLCCNSGPNSGNWDTIWDNGSAPTLLKWRVGSSTTVLQLPITRSQWQHIAISRVNGVVRGFVDGQVPSSGTVSAASTTNLTDTSGFRFGRNRSGAGYSQCYIDGFRATFGVGRFTSAFTPPTAAFPATNGDPDFADVVLLMQESFADESLLGSTVTNNGATLDTTSPKVGTASLAFNGSSHVSIAHDANQAWGTGDFTIEYWLYADSPSTTNYKVLNKDGSIGRCFVNNFNSSYGGAGALTFALPGVTASIITVGTVPNATWTYVTISRTNGTLYYGLNGNLQSQTNYTHNFTSGNNPIEIAKHANYGGSPLVGKIDSLRITKAGRYQANFTPPATEFPN